jgi:hypothetical protein
MEFAPPLAALDIEFKAIPKQEFDQMADLHGEATHDPFMMLRTWALS